MKVTNRHREKRWIAVGSDFFYGKVHESISGCLQCYCNCVMQFWLVSKVFFTVRVTFLIKASSALGPIDRLCSMHNNNHRKVCSKFQLSVTCGLSSSLPFLRCGVGLTTTKNPVFIARNVIKKIPRIRSVQQSRTSATKTSLTQRRHSEKWWKQKLKENLFVDVSAPGSFMIHVFVINSLTYVYDD